MRKIRKTSLKENENEYINPEEIKNELNDIELDRINKTNGFDKLYNLGISCCSFILKSTIFLFKISGIYLLWICLHYFSAHLYIKFCVPNSLFGFIMSPFMISTPHCQGLRWIVYNAANIINHMWILIGAWVYSILWIVNNNNNNSNMNNVL